MLITNDPELAQYGEACGVARIFVDLERHGKHERQGHLDTLISQHEMQDVERIRAVLNKAELLVRINPMYDGTEVEVNRAIENGADIIMLPMFRSAEELRLLVSYVQGRAKVIPLVETYDAVKSITEILTIKGVSEIYIGLNDLHLDMKLTFMFEPLANGLIDDLAKKIRACGMPFGFGGIARVGEGIIPGEVILGEHLRLGSSSVILSRTFHRKNTDTAALKNNQDLKNELMKLTEAYYRLEKRDNQKKEADFERMRDVVKEFVASKYA